MYNSVVKICCPDDYEFDVYIHLILSDRVSNVQCEVFQSVHICKVSDLIGDNNISSTNNSFIVPINIIAKYCEEIIKNKR
ncbi:hypothetical protein QE152_g30206 [Popillia japonica]|uniref:Uncharacterized protein n=1 Tax=Popillia japonica TaxID=7064 RepID=A0AAW1JEI5_POPJA